jgi:hypothetical protein
MIELRVKIYNYDERQTHELTGRGETVAEAQYQALSTARKLLGNDFLEVKSWKRIGELEK